MIEEWIIGLGATDIVRRSAPGAHIIEFTMNNERYRHAFKGGISDSDMISAIEASIAADELPAAGD